MTQEKNDKYGSRDHESRNALFDEMWKDHMLMYGSLDKVHEGQKFHYMPVPGTQEEVDR